MPADTFPTGSTFAVAELETNNSVTLSTPLIRGCRVGEPRGLPRRGRRPLSRSGLRFYPSRRRFASGWPRRARILGEDLDTDDDGTLDVLPWTALVDGVAFDRGAGQIYSSSNAGDVGGASRIPNGEDQDQAADWQANDFDGAGLDGFGGVPDQGEAWNTPGAGNRTNVVDYYAGVVLQDAATLRSLLHELIDDHVRYPYSSAETDTWDILEQADEDPTNAANVLTIYKNSSEVKFGGGTGPYNREHTWPRTFGFPDQQDGLGPSYPYRSVVLAWHAADPPDADEMLRNEVVYRYQGNRNPFVDHPEWVGCVYQGIGCDTPFFRDGFESGDLDGWSAASP